MACTAYPPSDADKCCDFCGERVPVRVIDNDGYAPQDFGWVLLELMGHRQRIGQAREEYVGSGKMIRIDIPTSDGDMVTEFYGTNAVYSLRPISEDVAKDHWAAKDPRPIRPAPYRPQSQIEHYDDDQDDEPH